MIEWSKCRKKDIEIDRLFSVLQTTMSCCKWSKSDWALVLLGVLQGTVLGPLYINDTSSDIKSEIRLFADS